MIKDVEVAMVHAANYALDYQDKKHNSDIEEIIKQFLKEFNFEIKAELKIYSIAAINEILKLKLKNRGKSNKQLIQIFIKSVPEISRRIKEEDSE